MFEVTCDASKTRIGEDLSENGHPIEFGSEKLKQPQANYSTIDAELYVVVRALRYWRHYLTHREFILNGNHESLNFI